MLKSQIKRIDSEITNINNKISEEKKKEASTIITKNKAQSKLSKAKSHSVVKSALREIDRANNVHSKSLNNQVDLAKKLSAKSTELSKKREELIKAQHKESEKQTKEQQKSRKRITNEPKEVTATIN